MRLILCVLALSFIAGCATTPIPAELAEPAGKNRLLAFQQPPNQPNGIIMVTRDTGIAGSACQVFIYIDGLHTASVWSGETAKFYVPVGEHVIGVNTSWYCGGGLKEHQHLIEANKAHRFRISADSNFSMQIAPTAF